MEYNKALSPKYLWWSVSFILSLSITKTPLHHRSPRILHQCTLHCVTEMTESQPHYTQTLAVDSISRSNISLVKDIHFGLHVQVGFVLYHSALWTCIPAAGSKDYTSTCQAHLLPRNFGPPGSSLSSTCPPSPEISIARSKSLKGSLLWTASVRRRL